ncbi:MAG: 2-dehydropantoate 2-reductase [Alphaproteobacteria bacterium]|nr:2-dehydropantoate 2-reductase [Alphaproteobacteria bacterium]
MNIVIFGTGAVGGYFGARLAAAGNRVSFVARGAQLEGLRRNGLRIVSPKGDLHLPKVEASDDPAAFGKADIVLFCVKLYDTEEVARKLAPLLHADTAVVSLQNGVDSEERVAAIIGKKHVAGGLAYIFAQIDGPGVIRHNNQIHKIIIGELDGSRSARLTAFVEACKKSGFDAELSQDIDTAIWSKFVFLASLAAMTGLTRQPIGAILADADLREMMRDAIAEVAAVAKAKGLKLAPDAVEKGMAFAATLPPASKASLAFDLDKGNRIEIEGLSGVVVRTGRSLGVPTPVHRAAYAALKPFAGGTPKSQPA